LARRILSAGLRSPPASSWRSSSWQQPGAATRLHAGTACRPNAMSRQGEVANHPGDNWLLNGVFLGRVYRGQSQDTGTLSLAHTETLRCDGKLRRMCSAHGWWRRSTHGLPKRPSRVIQRGSDRTRRTWRHRPMSATSARPIQSHSKPVIPPGNSITYIKVRT